MRTERIAGVAEVVALERMVEVGAIGVVVLGGRETQAALVGAGVIETEIEVEVVVGLVDVIFLVIGGEVVEEEEEEAVGVGAVMDEVAADSEATGTKEEGGDTVGEALEERMLRLRSCSRPAETPQVSRHCLSASVCGWRSEYHAVGINFDHYDDIPVEVRLRLLLSRHNASLAAAHKPQ